jgi:hypothetical protein
MSSWQRCSPDMLGLRPELLRDQTGLSYRIANLDGSTRSCRSLRCWCKSSWIALLSWSREAVRWTSCRLQSHRPLRITSRRSIPHRPEHRTVSRPSKCSKQRAWSPASHWGTTSFCRISRSSTCAGGCPTQNSEGRDPLARLKLNVICVERGSGTQLQSAFAYDLIVECLAAENTSMVFLKRMAG